MVNKITYWFKRKYRQIKNLIKWFPIIWNQFDFDYKYAIDVFKFQLEKIEKELNSDRALTNSAKTNARKIRTAIDLMDRVYDDKYSLEHFDQIRELYGKNALDWHFVESDKEGFYEIVHEYENWDNSEEIKKKLDELRLISKEKQKRAHKLLWDYIEHNIQNWWD